MIRYYGLDTITDQIRGNVVALGNFDGVHLGHREIFRTVNEHARRLGTRSAVVSFEPHPSKVLRPDKAPPLLSTYSEKLELIEACGIDYAVILKFDLEFSRTTHQHFIKHHLVEQLQVKHVVMGHLARFGKDRKGDARELERISSEFGFGVTEVGLLEIGGQKLSSSRIRRAALTGDIETTNRMLGRRLTLRGTVVRGDGRGRTIGIPTANLELTSELVPQNGVYAALAVVDGTQHTAVVNIGVRPTFNSSGRTIEAHLLDFAADLYGRELELQFVHHIRDEMRFSGPEALVTRIRADIEAVRRLEVG